MSAVAERGGGGRSIAPAVMASSMYSGATSMEGEPISESGNLQQGQGGKPVRSFFGLAGSGLPRSSQDDPDNDGTVGGLLKTALEDSLAVSCLYVVVVCGRGLTTPGAMSVFLHKDFWVWAALLVVCNVFLQVFYPALKQQLVQASVFSVVLVLMSPIKTRELVSGGE